MPPASRPSSSASALRPAIASPTETAVETTIVVMSFALRRPKSSSRSSSARGTIVSPEMRNIGATSGSSSGTRAPNTEAGRTDATRDRQQREHAARDDAQRRDGLDVAARDRLALDERRAVAGAREAVGDLVDDHHDRDRAELRRRDQVRQDDHRRERRGSPPRGGRATSSGRPGRSPRRDRRRSARRARRWCCVPAHDTSAGPSRARASAPRRRRPGRRRSCSG